MGINNRPFFRSLQTASWRGVPFAVTGSTVKVGRRVALHEYPYRDEVWVEDLGRAGRRISLTGFLLQDAAYGGGDVIAQRSALIAACEAPDEGAGELVHPSLGRITASLLDFECEERSERGRSFEVRFTFIEAGSEAFPSLSIATQAQTGLSVVAAYAAIAQDFANRALSFLQTPAIVGEVERAAVAFVVNAQSITQRATSLVAMVATLEGTYGRFVGEFTAALKQPSTSIAQLIGAGAQARQAVTQSGKALVAAASVVDSAAMASATQSLVRAVQNANTDPHQAIQSLAALQQETQPAIRATAGLTDANAAVTALFRRSTVIALADSTAGYALSSYDDTQALRSTVFDALDAELTIAADTGDDATFEALGALETAVVQDLATRGESLAGMRDVAMGASLPVIVLAQRLYQDVSRYDKLVQQINPVNPAFAPAAFSAAVD
ncbi:DNA circularization N-terminal domain-containing protein [Paraburkholderia azotifigens]|uniref:DNA circularization protein n=1 Tax=Paraburkholderia azotifigens TaxID=2057004 RepID=UPI003179CD54